MGENMAKEKLNAQGDVLEKTRNKVTKPSMYKVIMLNDDYTTMEFVIEVLEVIFHLPLPVATAIMLEIHKSGKGVAGIYTKEIAETKIAQVAAAAHRSGFPLLCKMEKA